jgi:hypothetical protein
MPSVTTWTRLEPRAREDDVRLGLQAQVYDALWLLARQWQLGEFSGEDSGSPVAARLEAESLALTRYLGSDLGDSGSAAGQLLDTRLVPLETLVEREAVLRGGATHFRLAADAGQHFRRLLASGNLSRYFPVYLSHYGFQTPSADAAAAYDDATLRFLRVVAGRAIDGARLFEALRTGNFPATALPGLPPDPGVPAADRLTALGVVQEWLGWYQSLVSEPVDSSTPWSPERMEYGFAVAASAPTGEVVLSAPEYVDGHLDWFDFSPRPGATLGGTAAEARVDTIRQATIPVPVTFPGMPANRWWEFEDRQIDFGSVTPSPDDLVSLVLIEFALIYGNDWFIIPVELGIGSLTAIQSLVVTDSFGQQTNIPPLTPPDAPPGAWRAFALAGGGAFGSRLFLPPVLGPSLSSAPVEEVWLLRDEMANLAWGVERVVETPAGVRLDRRDAYHARREASPPATASAGAPLVYRLAAEVPDYWIPLVPVPQPAGQGIRLQRGALARASAGGPARAHGHILGTQGPLLLYDEEVPRSGVRVTAAYQYARWIDGSSHLWRGRRKEVGRGEGSSGLRYDAVT